MIRQSPYQVKKYEGRVQRTQQVEFGAESGGVKKTATINQAAAAEFVKIDPTASVGKGGGTVTINGTSNSTKLTFSLTPDKSHPLTLQIPTSYQAAGKDTSNGAVIADDLVQQGALLSVSYSPVLQRTLI